MRTIRVLVTGAGAPGFLGTQRSLVFNYDHRHIDIISTDMEDDVYGKYHSKGFYQIPPATSDEYLDVITEIYDREEIDVLLPQNTMELEKLAKSEMNVCISENVWVANDKGLLYSVARECKVPIPKSMQITGKVVVKPRIGHGSKGLHIIEVGEGLVSEFVEGQEYTVDCFRDDKQFVAVPRRRDKIKHGISYKTTTENREDLIEYSRRLAETLDLRYAFGFQFIEDKLLECNPRVQGTMIASTYAGCNIIYSAVKSALKEEVPELKPIWGVQTIRTSVCKPISLGS